MGFAWASEVVAAGRGRPGASAVLLALGLLLGGAGAHPLIARPTCPSGHYRNGTLLFGCGEQLSGAHVLLGSNSGEAADASVTVTIPMGMQGLELRASAVAGLGLQASVKESGTDQEIVLCDPSDRSTTVSWLGVTLVTLGTASQSGLTQHVILKCADSLPAPLDITVSSQQPSVRSIVNVSFSCKNFQGCSTTPLGCLPYDSYEARSTVFNWSSWAQAEYSDVDLAWNALCVPATEGLQGVTEGGPVPFYLWQQVWSQWPGNSASGEAAWQAAFKFIDGLAGGKEDNHVDKEEFSSAFDLAGAFLSMYVWCDSLHKSFWTASAAWATYSGDAAIAPGSGIPFSAWESKVWSTYQPDAGFAKPPAMDAFIYVDADGSQDISEAEFTKVYDSCGGSTSPLFEESGASASQVASTSQVPGLTASAASPAGVDETSTAEMEAALLGTWQHPGSSYTLSQGVGSQLEVDADFGQGLHVSGPLQPEGQWLQGDLVTDAGEPFGELRVRFDSATNTAISNFRSTQTSDWGPDVVATKASTTSSIWSSAVPVSGEEGAGGSSGQACCTDMHAACLACQAGSSVAAICAKPFLSNTPGCRATTDQSGLEATAEETSASAADFSAQQQVGCLYDGVAYGTTMPGQVPSSELDIAHCQERCARTAGCTRFSFRKAPKVFNALTHSRNGTCSISDSMVGWGISNGTVSGPPHCIVMVQTRVSAIIFEHLTESQRETLAGRLSGEIASAAGIPENAVRDSYGQKGRVTLASGSLVSLGYVDVPPGWTLARLKSRLGGGKLRDRALSCLADVNITSALQANATLEHLLVGTLLGTVPEAQCFLLHTTYSPSMEGQDGSADNATACQARCHAQPRCGHFVFRRSSLACSLHEAYATPSFDANATAGPRICTPLPTVPEPPDSDEVAGEGSSSSDAMSILGTVWWWVWTFLPLIILLALACVCGLALRRTLLPQMFLRRAGLQPAAEAKRSAKVPPHLYQPLSSEEHHNGSARGTHLAVKPQDCKDYQNGSVPGPHLAVKSREVCVAPDRPRAVPTAAPPPQHPSGSSGGGGYTSGLPAWMPHFLGPEDTVSSFASHGHSQAPSQAAVAEAAAGAAAIAGQGAQQHAYPEAMVATAPGHLWAASAHQPLAPLVLPPPVAATSPLPTWGGAAAASRESGYFSQAPSWGVGVDGYMHQVMVAAGWPAAEGAYPQAVGPPHLRLPPPTPLEEPSFSSFQLLSPPSGVLAPSFALGEQLEGAPHLDIHGLPIT